MIYQKLLGIEKSFAKRGMKAFEKIEMEGKWRLLLQVLRELAEENEKLAEILRNFGLL